MPAGLRSQTPMNQTAVKPNLAMASHSAEGTELKSTEVPVFRLSSESQTQVLISYNVGYRGQVDKVIPSSVRPANQQLTAGPERYYSATIIHYSLGFQFRHEPLSR